MANAGVEGISTGSRWIILHSTESLSLHIQHHASFFEIEASCFMAQPVGCLVVLGAVIGYFAAGASEEILIDATNLAVAR